MKSIFRISGLILLILISNSFKSCKNEKVPVLTTSVLTNITENSAYGGGTITSEGSGTVLERGVCWSTDMYPSIAGPKTIDGKGAGTFTSILSGLTGGTTYFVRAYATNMTGTGYGMAIAFATLGQETTALTLPATNITSLSATLNGTVKANNLTTTVTFEYGTTSGYGQTVTSGQSPVTGNDLINVNANISGLTLSTIYHFRVKAVNLLGTFYGNDIQFTTLGHVTTATTLAATEITSTSATLNGNVNANNSPATVTFEYGTTTGYGSTVTSSQSPVTGNTNTDVSANLTGLLTGTTYHFRVKAVNSFGTFYGTDMIFTTVTSIPTTGLIAYYPFNGNANDLSGNNLNGTVYGATLTTDRKGNPDKAYYFNGTDNYIKILSNPLLNTPIFTVAVWVNVEKFGGSPAELGFIIEKGVYPNYNYELSAVSTLGSNKTNTFFLGTNSGGNYTSVESTNSFNPNTWYLIVIINDGSNLKIYINTVTNGTVSSGGSQTNNNDIYIGRYEQDASYNYKGKIDDIRIYNRALSADEILLLYNELP